MKMIISPGAHFKRAMYWLVGALLCGVAGFTMLFIGRIPSSVAVGLAIISFVGFFYCFNRGYDMWNEGRKNG